MCAFVLLHTAAANPSNDDLRVFVLSTDRKGGEEGLFFDGFDYPFATRRLPTVHHTPDRARPLLHALVDFLFVVLPPFYAIVDDGAYETDFFAKPVHTPFLKVGGRD